MSATHADGVCPIHGREITSTYNCEHCGKPRPFSQRDGVGSGSQEGQR